MRLSFKSKWSGALILCSPEQPSNADSPIVVTLSGMLILCRLEQRQNARGPIYVTLSGMLILCRLEQSINADSPIVVTLSGMLILCSHEQPINASYGTCIKPYGMLIVFIMPVCCANNQTAGNRVQGKRTAIAARQPINTGDFHFLKLFCGFSPYSFCSSCDFFNS